jgi:hypothetical protein
MSTLTNSTHGFLHIHRGKNRRPAKAARDNSATSHITRWRGGGEVICGGSCLSRAFGRKEVPAFGGRDEEDGAVAGNGSELDCGGMNSHHGHGKLDNSCLLVWSYYCYCFLRVLSRSPSKVEVSINVWLIKRENDKAWICYGRMLWECLSFWYKFTTNQQSLSNLSSSDLVILEAINY